MPNPRIAILHQGCVPSYRRTFYERLGEKRARDYVVFHGQAEPGSGIAAAEPPFGFQHVEVRNRFWRVLGRTPGLPAGVPEDRRRELRCAGGRP